MAQYHQQFNQGDDPFHLQAADVDDHAVAKIPSTTHQNCFDPAWRSAAMLSANFSQLAPNLEGSAMLAPPWTRNIQRSEGCALFPCQDQNELPQSNCLSLSLFHSQSSNNIGFQRQFGHLQRSFATTHDQEIYADHEMLPQLFQLKRSNYILPAQELLNEFCNTLEVEGNLSKRKDLKTQQFEELHDLSTSPSSNYHLLHSLDLSELQKIKDKLISMLQEVDRRYKRYKEQMTGVALSFESAAGVGAASTYLMLASKTMSRHFKSLRDGIIAQLRATKKAMGDSTAGAPGSTTSNRGETPRLKLVDQLLRQQREFQQSTVMECHPWRPQRGLPEPAVCILRAWLFKHFLHPYPSDVDKHILARQTGLTRSQVSNWFINARVRLWKPMVEEMYLEETKEQANQADDHHQPSMNVGQSNENVDCFVDDHQQNIDNLKPTPPPLHFLSNRDNFSAAASELSFYNNGNINMTNFGNSSSRVSLKLGLEQHMDKSSSLFSAGYRNATVLYEGKQIDEQEMVHGFEG